MAKAPKMLLAHELREQMSKKVAELHVGRNPNQLLPEQYAWDMETYRRMFEIVGIYRMNCAVEMALSAAEVHVPDPHDPALRTFRKFFAIAQEEMLQGKR